MATKYAGFIDFISPNQNLPKMPDFLQSYNRNFNTQLSNLFAPIHPDGWGAYALGKSTDTAKNFSDVDLGSGSSTPSNSGSGTLSGGDPGVLKWSSQISNASKQFGVPQDVIAAIMTNESHGSQYSLSSAGAIGLMQVMPFHFDDGDGDPYDPQTNINKGASILKSNFDMAKSKYGVDDNKAWDIAAAAYLGDWDWKSGTYAGSSDAYGTNGPTYVQKFDDARKQYQVTASPTPAAYGGSGPASSSAAQNAISVANGLLGTPYNMVSNANDPSNGYVDCSGLVQYAFKQSGVNLPRVAQDQYNATQRIDASQLQPGDLVFFTKTYNAGTDVTHVGIYLGNGKMVDAQTSGVSIDNLSDPYWQQHLYGYGRVAAS